MPRGKNLSPGAALIAVATAFVVGLLASLSIRPPGAVASQTVTASAGAIREQVRWRVQSAYGVNLPVIGKNLPRLISDLKAVSANNIQLELFEPGELVPILEITESVKEAKIQAGYVWVGYDQGRIPASTLISAVPFGMEPSEFSSWWYYGGGRALGETLYHEHNVQPILCAISGPETAGWFREPITSLDDLVGLKIRFAGLGGKVLQRLGASVTIIPGGETFQALEKGAIDASEFSLPIVDEMLGFGRVAKFNYFPGWHQPFSAVHLLVNLRVWNDLTQETRDLFHLACRASVTDSMAHTGATQGEVIKNFADHGITASTLPMEILEALREVAKEVLDEEASKDEHFAKILASQRAFSETYSYWKRMGFLPRDF
jgi:TRAP-type mannitol/chloroaromatic compound transport system substrate-binding protein